jgi:ribosomal protein S27E
MITTYDVATVTCKKSGCGNRNISISVYKRPGNTVVCGVCNTVITDVVKTGTIDLDE